MSSCNASCYERSSSASFFALVKTLWETCLRLEDIDLSEVLAGPAEGSLLLEGMGWSTPRRGSKSHRWEEEDRPKPDLEVEASSQALVSLGAYRRPIRFQLGLALCAEK